MERNLDREESRSVSAAGGKAEQEWLCWADDPMTTKQSRLEFLSAGDLAETAKSLLNVPFALAMEAGGKKYVAQE
jgi:hypothetical protein